MQGMALEILSVRRFGLVSIWYSNSKTIRKQMCLHIVLKIPMNHFHHNDNRVPPKHIQVDRRFNSP